MILQFLLHLFQTIHPISHLNLQQRFNKIFQFVRLMQDNFQCLQLMNHPRVNCIDEYQSELMGYNIIGNKIVYLTQSELCIVRVGNKLKKQSTKMKGSNILNFVISKRGYVAFLYKSKTIQIRRMDNIGEVYQKFINIMINQQENYPKMKWDYDELYLIYPDNIEIINTKTKERKGYTDIVLQYQNERMLDMVISNLMDSERTVILHLTSRLIFTIIPIPITEIQIPNINTVLNLYSTSHQNDSRREYFAVLTSNRHLRIYNLLNLKQICQVDLQPKSNQLLQIESDPSHEAVLVRYVNSTNLAISKNIIYKINSNSYYSENNRYYEDKQPFFLYKFQITIFENLTLFPTLVQKIDNIVFDYYHLIFFKDGRLYEVFQFLPHNYSQTLKELKYVTQTQWVQYQQWKQIIAAYLQLASPEASKQQRMINFTEQDRQLYEYNIIKNQFDTIIAKFTEKINKNSKNNIMTEKNIEDQWASYLAQIAKQRNFLMDTMKLFKIQPQIIRKNNQQKRENALSNDIQTCIRDRQNRQSRIDAKIKEKKKELAEEQKQKTQISKQQIQRYQEDYEKFVAQFMQETERKERQQRQRKQKELKQKRDLKLEEKLTLILPNLNQQQKKMIKMYGNESDDKKQSDDILIPSQNEVLQSPNKPQLIQMEYIINFIEEKVALISKSVDPLIQKLKKIQQEGLERIIKNQNQLKQNCSLNFEKIVKDSCKKMMSSLNQKIKKQLQATTKQIYRLQEKNRAYYEDSIEKFKQYIDFQIKNRIEIFYKSRKNLQKRLSSISRQRTNQQENLDACEEQQ